MPYGKGTYGKKKGRPPKKKKTKKKKWGNYGNIANNEYNIKIVKNSRT